MALVKMKDLLLRAQKENKGCGAFSVGNMEMVKGAIKAAEELDTPIISFSHSSLSLSGVAGIHPSITSPSEAIFTFLKV